MKIAKLLVPAGGVGQFSAGETFSPTQFGLVLLLPAFFTASRSPSLKPGEVSVNTPCALASCVPHIAASATAPARSEPRKIMTSPFIFVDRFILVDRSKHHRAASPS